MNKQKIKLLKLLIGIIMFAPVISWVLKADARASDGAALFEAKCAVCHGQDGRGTDFGKEKGAPDFSDVKWQQSRTDAQIKEAIANGKGEFMPAWKNKLSEEEIKALVGRVRAFRKKG